MNLFGTVFFGLISAVTWGIGDFSGGVAARKMPARLAVLFSQVMGLATLVTLALLWGEPALSVRDVFISGAAGITGVLGLFTLYRVFAMGGVSLAAPIAGVVSTIVPVTFGMLTQGLPKLPILIGFALAIVGVWFVSRSTGAEDVPAAAETTTKRTVERAVPMQVLLPVISGLCFGAFLILISQVHSTAVFMPLVWARIASLTVMAVLVLSQREFAVPPKDALLPLVLCGFMDAMGNAFFVAAKLAGRLDVASALSSLYPASTVVLALLLFKERMNRFQAVGVVLILIAIPLIAA